MSTETRYFTEAERYKPQHRIDAAYKLAGIADAAPIIDVGALVTAALNNRIKTAREIAADLFASITDEASIEGAVDAALAEATVTAAHEAIRQEVAVLAHRGTPARFTRASATVAVDLEAAARKQISNLKRAAAKLAADGVTDPFDADALLAVEADLKAASAVREAIRALGVLVAAVDEPKAEDAKYAVLRAARILDVPLDLEATPIYWATREKLTEQPDAVKSLRSAFYAKQPLDVILYRIAAGQLPGLDLTWAPSRATVDARAASVHSAMKDRIVKDPAELDAFGVKRKLTNRLI